MIEILALEPVESESAPPPAMGTWGIREGLLLIGVVVLLTAIGLGVYAVRQRPQPPDRGLPSAEELRKDAHAWSPAQSLNVWRMWRSVGLQLLPRPNDQAYREALRAWRLWMALDAVGAIVGLGLVAGPLVSRRLEARRRAAPPHREGRAVS